MGLELAVRMGSVYTPVGLGVNRFRESVQTVSMFGGKRVVWFKDVNFLADTVTGRLLRAIENRLARR